MIHLTKNINCGHLDYVIVNRKSKRRGKKSLQHSFSHKLRKYFMYVYCILLLLFVFSLEFLLVSFAPSWVFIMFIPPEMLNKYENNYGLLLSRLSHQASH